MNVLDVNAAADVTPEPPPLPAGSAGECPLIDRAALPDPAHLTVRVSARRARPGIDHCDDRHRGICVAVGRKFCRTAPARNLHCVRSVAGADQDPSGGGDQHGNAGRPLRGQVQTILHQLPAAASKLSVALLSLREGQPNTMQKMQAAAREIDNATSQAGDIHSTPKQPATHIVIDQPGFKLGDDTFNHKLVRLAGPSLSGSSLAIATFVGICVITWMTGTFTRMNAVSAFIALLFWGWLWGAWVLLLAIPIIGTAKVISEPIKELQPLAELLRK